MLPNDETLMNSFIPPHLKLSLYEKALMYAVTALVL